MKTLEYIKTFEPHFSNDPFKAIVMKGPWSRHRPRVLM